MVHEHRLLMVLHLFLVSPNGNQRFVTREIFTLYTLVIFKVVFSTETGGKIKADAIPIQITGESGFQLTSKTSSASSQHASTVEFGQLLPGGAKTGELTFGGFRQGFALGKYLREKYELEDPTEIFTRSTAANRTIETARSILAGILEDRPTEMKIEIAAPEQEFMIIKSEKLAKYPNIQAIDKFLKAASVLNQTQSKLAQDAMKLANVRWEEAQGIDFY